MKNEQIDGQLWAKLIIFASNYLEDRKNVVDLLNVFPVPDGDTGTNMSLTMASAARAIQQKKDRQIGNAAKTISYGALMGARGNSGVILSQLFAGFAKASEGKEFLTARQFSQAFDLAAETAYQAVMNPVEGTILTVSKEAARAANEVLEGDSAAPTIETVLEAAYRGALDALAMTPDLLPVLKQAGVVDAGGQGFVFILEAMLSVLRGEEDAPGVPIMAVEPPRKKAEAGYFNGEILEYQYCTEFILKKKEISLEPESIRAFLAGKGDCTLVVGNQETTKIHIHTNNPGTVLEYCTNLGSLHEIKIDNMSEQSREMLLKARAVKHLGIVGVSAGTGITEIYKSLGVDAVIAGGQTMNPSTEDFLEAIDNISAEEALILPNNSNIILAAQQAANVASKPCRVVSTMTIPQGIAALMAFNSEQDIDYNKSKMEEAAKQIVTLEVTFAVRDSHYEEYVIKKGQILGLANGKISVIGTKTDNVVGELIVKNLKPGHELITIYHGEDVSEDDARKVVEKLSQQYPDVDFELHFGGQPLYYYLISLE